MRGLKGQSRFARAFAAAHVWAHLSDDERSVLGEMSDGEMVYPADQTAADAGVPLARTRAIMRRFREIGLARFGPLRTDENKVAGCGYWLTREGSFVLDYYRLSGMCQV